MFEFNVKGQRSYATLPNHLATEDVHLRTILAVWCKTSLFILYLQHSFFETCGTGGRVVGGGVGGFVTTIDVGHTA